MAFIDELENNIWTLYFKILEKKQPKKTTGKVLNCDSFRKIAEEIKSVIGDGIKRGSDVFEIASNIIFRILNKNFFVYENHEMAASIGYIYLKRQKADVNNYTPKGIKNDSTLEEIRFLTALWHKS